jgi:signal transduction histidine kinase/ActR/RegA family two-component response regulator
MDITKEMLGHFSAFAPSNSAVYHVSEAGALDTLYLSENIPALLDMTREEYLKITEHDAMDLALPNDRPGLLKATMRCVKNGESFEYHYRVFHKTKGFEWVHVYAHVCGSMEGRPLILALFSNMTSEGGIYQQLLDASDRKILVVDRNSFEILYSNENARITDSGQKESLLNETCYSLLHGAGKPCEHCFLSRPQGDGLMEDVLFDRARGKWEQIVRRQITWCGHDALLIYIKDVTAERNSELDVERFKQMYADATQEAKLVVWTYDAESHRADMLWDGYTKVICQKLGIPRVIENIPDRLLPYVGEQDRAAFVEMYKAIDRGELRSECEFHFQVPAQEHVEVERAVAQVIFDEDGRRLGVYCFGQNITAQKAEEDKYRLAYAELEEAHPYSLGSFRLNLTKNWCGGGKSPYDYILEQQKSGTADGYFSAFSALIDDAEIKKKFFRKFDRLSLLDGFSKGVEKVSIQYPAVDSKGVRRWFEGLLFMMRNPKTGDVEGVTYAMDISAQKRGELILEKLINENFDYIGIIRAKSRTFEFVSRKSWIKDLADGEQFDYDKGREYIISKFENAEEIKNYKDVTSLEHILPILYDNGNCSETYLQTYDGRAKCVRLFFSWLEQPGGDILLIRSDITDSYEQEQRRLARMRDALLAADRANEERSAFLSTMSHDLRTPLNGVISFTDFALEEKDPARKQEYLQKVKLSGDLLLSLVNDTLELSRIESGKMTVTPEVVSTNEIGPSVIESLRPVAEAKGVQLFSCMSPAEYIYADKLKLQKIWVNLLSNAIKYTPTGGIVRAYEEAIEPPVEGRNRRIVVEDSGIGMSEEFMARMFEPFSQENRFEAGNVAGTGLGLAIVKRLVALLGGTISVKSQLNKGSRFEVDIPVQPAAENSIEADLAGRPESMLAVKRVLLCEDNLLNREIAATLLRSREIAVDCAENGGIGLQMYRDSPFGYYEAILMDIRMPVMDGYAAAKAIRALNRQDARSVPIIAMTADIFEESIQAAHAAGMNAYITKPIIPEKLFAALSEVCSGR